MSVDHFPHYLVFGGLVLLAVVGFGLSWVLGQIDKATTYPAVTR